MITSYFNHILRNIRKNKVASFITIAGLSLGLASVIIITAYIKHELSYDRYHEDYQNIYRITTDWMHNGSQEHSALSFSPLNPILNENLKGLKYQTRIFAHSGLVNAPEKAKTRENKFCFADSSFFKVFTFESIDGTLHDALVSPYSTVVSEAAALRLFGTSQAVGKEFFFEDSRRKISCTVTAVIKDMPANSHFKFEFITSLSTLKELWPNALVNWHFPPVYQYIKTDASQSIESINNQLRQITTNHLPDYVKKENRKFIAQPLRDIHLNSNLTNEWTSNSSSTDVLTFGLISIFILVIASINYINLTIANSLSRIKEVGVRKSIGSLRHQLVFMFIYESLFLVLVSLILALAIATAIAPTLFYGLLGYALDITALISIEWWVAVISGTVLLGIMTGLYPALMMSAVKTTDALKRRIENGISLGGLRKGLVAFQFIVSSILLTGLLIIGQQNNYIQTKDLGFNRDHTLAINLSDGEAQKNYITLKNRLLQESFVKQACVSAALPASDGFYAWTIKPEGHDGIEMNMKSINTDEDFISTYDVELISGRDFDKRIITDAEEAFILNEAAIKKLNWEDPIGKSIELTFYTNQENIRKGKVIGVVKDFHFQTLYNTIEPLIIFINTHPYYTDYLTLNLAPGNVQDQLSTIESIWKDYNKDKPLEYTFLDDTLNHLYQKEQRTNAILSLFTGLSIIISALGLFGLLSISLERRTKEIGIRKILGSNSTQIMKLVSKDLLILIVVANLIAAPIAMWVAKDWLSQFAYHIEPGVLPILISGLVLVLIAILTISGKVIHASLTNPVKALRQE